MPHFAIRTSLAATLLIGVAACTQPAANVELKGDKFYGRNAAHESNSYAANNPIQPVVSSGYTTAKAPRNVDTKVQTAAAPTIVTSSDLAPPPKVAQAAPVVAAAAPAAKPQVVAAAAPAPVNQWTKKPHDVAAAASAPAPIGVYNTPVKTASTGFTWPVSSHKVISGFGPKGGGKVNDGINIASTDGEPVWAAADGEIVYAGNGVSGYGNMVLIRHDGGKVTSYAHMGRMNVEKYDRVKQGDIIGYVGSTGDVKTPQLHFAIRDGKDPVDPQKYLVSKVASN